MHNLYCKIKGKANKKLKNQKDGILKLRIRKKLCYVYLQESRVSFLISTHQGDYNNPVLITLVSKPIVIIFIKFRNTKISRFKFDLQSMYILVHYISEFHQMNKSLPQTLIY